MQDAPQPPPPRPTQAAEDGTTAPPGMDPWEWSGPPPSDTDESPPSAAPAPLPPPVKAPPPRARLRVKAPPPAWDQWADQRACRGSIATADPTARSAADHPAPAAPAAGAAAANNGDDFNPANYRFIFDGPPRVGDSVVNARQSDEQLEYRLQCMELELERLFYLVQDLC